MNDTRQTKTVKVYLESIDYIKKFYVPFEDTFADALEKALTLGRSSDRKGKKHDRRSQKNAGDKT